MSEPSPMRLPESVQRIAEVIGIDATLTLIGQLPTCYSGQPGKKSTRVILYVPRKLRPDHRLVTILGWPTAAKLARYFGGEILQPANCREVFRSFRDSEIRRMLVEGYSVAEIAELVGLTERHVQNVAKEKPQEEIPAGHANTPRIRQPNREPVHG